VNGHLSRLGIATVAALTIGTAVISTASAATPTLETWSNHSLSVDYFECGDQPINGDWIVTHHLTTFYNKDGTPARDIEKIDFVGAFVNPANGASIPDSGQIVFFDTLAPDYSYLATVMNVVRKSAYLHAAGRNDFDSGKSVGMDNWDAGVAAACAALGV
jgi:hypothetical protein